MSFHFEIDGPVDLGGGYRLHAAGFRGSGTATEPSDYLAGATRSATAGRALSDVLADALDTAGMIEEQAIELSLTPDPRAGSTRSARDEEAILLEAPDLGFSRGQVVILTDEDGGISFHYPVESEQNQELQPVGVRGASGVKLFVIPTEVPPGPPITGDETRSLVGLIGRKLVQVFSFPVLAAIGGLATPVVRGWEEKYRAYEVRWFGPDDFTQGGGRAVSNNDWSALGGARALLFVHGTFATARGAFSAIPKQVMDGFWKRYQGRVIAFNHHSIAADPVENVRWFLERVPAGVALELDVVSHSRGGLVARVLAGAHPDAGLDLSRVRVHSVICAGTPNYGTPLADASHVSALCDRLATASNLIPGLPVAEIIDAVLLLVQLVAQAALEGLNGLEAMQPRSEFLRIINAASNSSTRYFGIAADYTPNERGMKRVVEGLKNVAVDFVFGYIPNDLVVPTIGVHSGSGAFGIERDDLIQFGPERGIMHSSFWRQPEVSAALASWLPGAVA